jgi:putative transposase
LLANVPNQVWSWDITKLLGPVRWTYFYLYVILDIFSSYVVGWMVANRESAELAKRLIAETCQKQKIALDQLTLHADRGASMRSKPVALRLADPGVTKAHSWPHASDDNPFSESHFKTLKYRPEFPDRFGSIQDARAFCQAFFPWYNRPAHARGPSLRLGRRDHRPTPDCFEPGVRTESRTLRPGASQTAGQTHAVWINPPAVRAASEQEQH